MISINLNLFATLRPLLPDGPKAVAMPRGCDVKAVLDHYNIPEDEVKLIFVNGQRKSLACTLEDGDRVGIFPPVGGG